MEMEQTLITSLLIMSGSMGLMNITSLIGWSTSFKKANEYGAKVLSLFEELQQQTIEVIEAKKAHRDTISEQQKILVKLSKKAKWSEGLILQLPDDHDGRNSWLINHGTSEEANTIRFKHSKKIYDECSTVVSVKREEK